MSPSSTPSTCTFVDVGSSPPAGCPPSPALSVAASSATASTMGPPHPPRPYGPTWESAWSRRESRSASQSPAGARAASTPVAAAGMVDVEGGSPVVAEDPEGEPEAQAATMRPAAATRGRNRFMPLGRHLPSAGSRNRGISPRSGPAPTYPRVVPDFHFEPLSHLDRSFLALESRTTHMHVTGVAIFRANELGRADGSIDFGRIRSHIESKLQYIPRYRQRLAFVPYTGAPVWSDDVDFNLDYHVRHTSLPRPGTDDQLKKLAGRIVSQQLDRSKPLWELWVV